MLHHGGLTAWDWKAACGEPARRNVPWAILNWYQPCDPCLGEGLQPVAMPLLRLVSVKATREWPVVRGKHGWREFLRLGSARRRRVQQRCPHISSRTSIWIVAPARLASIAS